MDELILRSIAKRKYAKIPVDKIRVLNSRSRDMDKFNENIRSIRDVGLLKPIVVNERNYSKNGHYELVCGQGRYLAYKSLAYTDIPAEVINCDKKQALLYSLVENIARVPPGTMWFAREVKRMHDAGCSLDYIANVTGNSTVYISEYIRLVEQGEERLIKGVESNLFPISFAIEVAKADNATIQNVLMDAFDRGIVNSRNLPLVRRILDSRIKPRKGDQKSYGPRKPIEDYTIKQLRTDIRKITKEKEAFVNETALKETRLMSLLDGIHTLLKDQQFTSLLNSEGLGQVPQLQGIYNV